MILAAGEGTRLRPLTLSTPKPMIPIVGKPLLAWTLEWLAAQGVTHAVLNLYHRPLSIPDFFGDTYAGIVLHYSFEDTLRGTAGGVRGAADFFRDAPFFVVYGDNLLHAELAPLMEFHAQHGGAATVALFEHPNPSAAGIVGLDSDGRITRFVEKPAPDQIFSCRANAGVYVLDPSVLDAIPSDAPSDFGRDIFPALLARGEKLCGMDLGGYLQDTGTPQSYRQACWDALAGRVGTQFADAALWLGPGARVHPDAALHGRNILGANSVVGAGATLTDCLLWDGAEVGPGAQLSQAILGTRAFVGAGQIVPPGALLASNCVYDEPATSLRLPGV